MNDRIVKIRQPHHMSLEAIYYDSKRDTIITITKDTRLGKAGTTYEAFAVIQDKKDQALARTKIFNIHLPNDHEIKSCADKLKEFKPLCFYSQADGIKINNNDFRYDYAFEGFNSPNSSVYQSNPEKDLLPDVRFELDDVKVHAAASSTKTNGSSGRARGYGYNYYKKDVDNGLLETFFETGNLPLPVQKPSANRLLNSVGIGVALILGLGFFAKQAGAVDAIVDNFNPSLRG